MLHKRIISIGLKTNAVPGEITQEHIETLFLWAKIQLKIHNNQIKWHQNRKKNDILKYPKPPDPERILSLYFDLCQIVDLEKSNRETTHVLVQIYNGKKDSIEDGLRKYDTEPLSNIDLKLKNIFIRITQTISGVRSFIFFDLNDCPDAYRDEEFKDFLKFAKEIFKHKKYFNKGDYSSVLNPAKKTKHRTEECS